MNRPRLLRDGAEAFPAMLAAIRGAKRFILMETYIFASDPVGIRFARALAERAAHGVEVSLMYDSLGSGRLSGEVSGILKAGGVRVVSYHPVRLSLHLWEWRQWGKRNHRKQLIVDGQVGFVGGINIHEEEMSWSAGGGGWRDTHLRIEGHPIVEMIRLFVAAWDSQKGAALDPEIRHLEAAGHLLRRTGWRVAWAALRRRVALGGRNVAFREGHIEVIGSATHSERSRIRRAYLYALRHAKRSVFLTSAYFVPDLRIQAALRAAGRRGVLVSVLVAGAPDVLAVLLAGRALYGRLLASGVRLYELRGRVLHAKTAVVDGAWCTVGSFNMDHRSWRYNLESNAVAVDERLGASLEAAFREDLRAATPILPEAWSRRGVVERVGEFFFWLFRYWL